MPIMLPPKRRRSKPKVSEDAEGDTDTAMKVSIICVLLIANLIVFVSKYSPDNHYAVAAAPSDTMQLSP